MSDDWRAYEAAARAEVEAAWIWDGGEAARADVPDEKAQHALGLPVLVRAGPAGTWEVVEIDAAAGLERVRALYEARASAEEHADRLRDHACSCGQNHSPYWVKHEEANDGH